VNFQFSGPGFNLTNVDVSSTFGSVTDENSAITAINNAITSTGVGNATFAAAGIHASMDSTGHLVFTGSGSFAVQSSGASGALLLGVATSTNKATGNASVTQAWGGTITATQSWSFAWRDSAGASHSYQLTPVTGTLAVDVAALNTNATLSGGGIFAEANAGGGITFVKADGGQFTVTSVHTGNAALGVADGTYGSVTTPLSPNATTLDIASATDASSAVTALSTAVNNLGTVQGTVGRSENQLGYAINLAQSQLTNMSAAESRIRDADLAAEAANLTKAQILMQAGTAALAQANSAPQVVLSLLKG
jgi:flagellin